MIVEVVRPRLARPFRISRGVQDVAELIEVTVERDGVQGHGEAAPQEDDGQTVDDALAALAACGEVLGDDPFAFAEIEERTRPWREATAAMAQDASRWVARFPDVRYLKLKLGAGDGRDVERVRAVRAVTALPFLVDANAATACPTWPAARRSRTGSTSSSSSAAGSARRCAWSTPRALWTCA